ncbi:hypothetical protein [Vibrio crassostreae]|uniref:hypothetical protein n=1 Tax=Vibrio crassostreae TaxID=246167 RepID=UPI000630D30F|nr:hypothetical protein [Vibrio crassostreae]RPF03464.1 hypothetical protein EDB17_2604 [Vibrio crassostreae]TCO06736.1 hypothetical protein EDB30_101588 [Vibrio crassostreae]CAK1773821.1 Chromosome partitioning protein ParA [Vibrio crassostreae]CAK1845175.1 Chromosome partitioning protein ParA [Vibrio crassostreae]CAK1906451.1 Chromosome partitioning protein ParA [Vibrio crassostreae]
MFTEAMTSIKAYLYERAVSPLLGSFIVSWCFWNYRFFFLAVSDFKYTEKMAEIDKFYQIKETHNLFWLVDWTVSNFWALGVAFPFITSMLYLFAFTYPAEWVYRFSLNRQKIMGDLKKEKQENELLTLEQSKSIRNQLAETEKQFDEQIERKDRAIEARDRQIEELQELVNEKSKDKQGQENDSDKSQQELLDTIKGLQKKVEDLENDDSIFRVNTGQGSDESSVDSEDSNEAQLKGLTTTLQRPDYINFYEDLDWEEKSAVEHIVSIVQDKGPEVDELQSQLLNVSPNNEIAIDAKALNKLLSKMKAFDIIGVDYVSLGNYYELAVNGKPLYRYILGRSNDDKYPKPDSSNRDTTKKSHDKDVSFYFDADEHTQKRYKRILEGLFLEERRRNEFGLRSDLFDSTVVQLILHGLVHQPNDLGKYRITEDGRSFYTNMNNMKAG